MKQWLLFPVSLLLGLLALTALQKQAPADIHTRQFSQKVNLALRYTGDRLLRMAGDSSSRIPVVQHYPPNEWLLRLERQFNYDSLPHLLETAFAAHGVVGDYEVAVLDCADGGLLLGYSFSALQPGTPPTCTGREMEASCLNIKITFPHLTAPESFRWPYWLASLAGLVGLAGLVQFFFFYRKKTVPVPVQPHALEGETPAPPANEIAALHLGQTVFDPSNQTLLVAGHRKTLTYREAKLLQHFIRHPNELLSREHILEAVWKDEGILVGRSVDVFVSRLRKILREDETLQLVNVHGVGYRLQVGRLEA